MISANLYKEIKVPKTLNPQTIEELYQQISSLEETSIRFVILKGEADYFCEGLDIRWIAENDAAAFKKDILLFNQILKKLQTGKFISIAVASGNIAGGGMGLVCACDYVIAETKSNYSLPEGLLGLVPGVIFPALLNKMTPRIIKKMFLSGSKFTAADALNWGIADEVVNSDSVEQSLNVAMKAFHSTKKDAIGDFKTLLYDSVFDNEKLFFEGMDLLIKKLSDPSIKERLINIADFMD